MYSHAHIWRSWSTEVSVPHGECFLGLGFAQPSVLITAVTATSSYPVPGPLMSTPLINTGQPTLNVFTTIQTLRPTVPVFIINIIRRSGINPTPPTVKDRDYKGKKQRKMNDY